MYYILCITYYWKPDVFFLFIKLKKKKQKVFYFFFVKKIKNYTIENCGKPLKPYSTAVLL